MSTRKLLFFIRYQRKTPQDTPKIQRHEGQSRQNGISGYEALLVGDMGGEIKQIDGLVAAKEPIRLGA